MSTEFINIYLLICGLHGIIQSFILFKSRKDYEPNKFLSVYIFAFSIILIENSLKIIDGAFKLPDFISLPFLFFGHALLFYAKSILGRRVKRHELILHTIPAFLLLVVFLTNFFSGMIGLLPKVLDFEPRLNNIIINSLGAIHMLLYLAVTVKVLKRFKSKEDSKLSFKISWIFFLITISFTISVLVLSIITYNVIMDNPFDVRIAYFVWVIMTSIVYGIGYTSLSKPEVFQKSSQELLNSFSKSITKYRHTRVSEDKFHEVVERLQNLLEKEFLYRDPNLRLTSMAKIMDIRPNILSRIINEHYNLNFNQLINNYRIEEVQQKLADPKFDKYTILGIAFEVGFNSKSSFNSAFKNKLGLSPKEFRKSTRYSR